MVRKAPWADARSFTGERIAVGNNIEMDAGPSPESVTIVSRTAMFGNSGKAPLQD
jgi:hypothetical protein